MCVDTCSYRSCGGGFAPKRRKLDDKSIDSEWYLFDIVLRSNTVLDIETVSLFVSS